MTPSFRNPETIPVPAGHYHHVACGGGLIFVSGQLPAGVSPQASFEEQAAQAIHNMLACLASGGGSPASLLQVTVYVVDVANWPRFNRVYAEIMGEARPARAVVPVPELHYGYAVEITAVAVPA